MMRYTHPNMEPTASMGWGGIILAHKKFTHEHNNLQLCLSLETWQHLAGSDKHLKNSFNNFNFKMKPVHQNNKKTFVSY